VFEGGIHVMLICPTPDALACTFVGGSGIAVSVTWSEGAEARLSPTSLVATRVKLYVVPGARPVTVVPVADAPRVSPPAPVQSGEQVTVYAVIGLPLLAGATHVSAALVSDAATAPVIEGLEGTSGVVTANALVTVDPAP
jgi:hypothetical protein